MLTQAEPRDFHGYGNKQPKINWPGNARVAVSFVVNVEEGAELSLSAGDEQNENAYEVPMNEKVLDTPDLCMESHYEYGTRAGYWRVANLLEQFGISAKTVFCIISHFAPNPCILPTLLMHHFGFFSPDATLEGCNFALRWNWATNFISRGKYASRAFVLRYFSVANLLWKKTMSSGRKKLRFSKICTAKVGG